MKQCQNMHVNGQLRALKISELGSVKQGLKMYPDAD